MVEVTAVVALVFQSTPSHGGRQLSGNITLLLTFFYIIREDYFDKQRYLHPPSLILNSHRIYNDREPA